MLSPCARGEKVDALRLKWTMPIKTITVQNTFELDAVLSALYDADVEASLPLIDRSGSAAIACGTAPDGDWQVVFGHNLDDDWEPDYPLVGMLTRENDAIVRESFDND